MNNFKVLMNGIVKENPTFVLLLGMCPTLGTTSSAMNGMGMGLATAFVLICSNVVISAIKNLIPDMVRIPAFVVVIASFVTLLQMIMQAYVPGLYATLGLFIPLIVVNCILLGRAEAFAAKNGPVASMFDGLGMGLGFTVGLTLLGAVRELLGTGKIFGLTIMPEDYDVYKRNTIAFRNSYEPTKWLKFSSSVNFARSQTDAVGAFQGASVIDGLYEISRDVSIVDMKDLSSIDFDDREALFRESFAYRSDYFTKAYERDPSDMQRRNDCEWMEAALELFEEQVYERNFWYCEYDYIAVAER